MDRTLLKLLKGKAWFVQYEPAIFTRNRHRYEGIYKMKYTFIQLAKKMCWQILSISIDVYIIARVVFWSSFFITDLKV